MTWLEIVDSAVKVGLGAAISGVAALALARSTRKAEREKAYLKRRQGFLDLFLDDFEPIHIEIYERAGKIHTMLKAIDAGFANDIEPATGPDQQVESIEDSIEYRAGIILYRLHARLLYLNLIEVAALLQQYRNKVVELNGMLPSVSELTAFIRSGAHEADLGSLQSNADELSHLRDEIYVKLGIADRGEKP